MARSAGHACHWSSCFACCPLACHRHKYFLVYVHVSRTSFYRIQQLMSSRQTHSPPRRLNGNHHLYRPSHSNSHPPPPPPPTPTPQKRESPHQCFTGCRQEPVTVLILLTSTGPLPAAWWRCRRVPGTLAAISSSIDSPHRCRGGGGRGGGRSGGGAGLPSFTPSARL